MIRGARKLRGVVLDSLGTASTELSEESPVRFEFSGSGTSSIARLSATPLEKRLARILEINTELLGEVDVGRLAARVTDHAVDMLQAERGFVLLREPSGALHVHTSRSRGVDLSRAEFSRSIAEQVVQTGEPVVAVNAKGDSRLRGFKSVHQLSLESVACVPIQARSGSAIGALYVETRLRPGSSFERELPTLAAFADQVGIALETAALIGENAARAEQLAEANLELEESASRAQGAPRRPHGATQQSAPKASRRSRHSVWSLRLSRSGRHERRDAQGVRAHRTGEEHGRPGAHHRGERNRQRGRGAGHPPGFDARGEAVLRLELWRRTRASFGERALRSRPRRVHRSRSRKKRVSSAKAGNGGTLLLDEIGEMPAKMQTSLLRVLQDHKVRPVGDTREYEVDVRLMFATHRDLEGMSESG